MPAATTRAGRRPTAIGNVRRPIVRSAASSSTSFTTSRTRCNQAASTQGTTPAAGSPTASAPKNGGDPPTTATATFPSNGPGFRGGAQRNKTATAANEAGDHAPRTQPPPPPPPHPPA